MKGLFKLVAIVALLNLGAILGFIGWLVASGRLDKARATEIRAMLTETIAEQQAREAAEAEQDDDGEALPEPKSIEQALHEAQEAGDVALQRRLRSEQDNQRLLESLHREQRELDKARDEFLAERKAFLEMRDRIAQIEGDAQFRKSLGVLEGLKAPDAMANLLALLGAGKREEVVAYLDAMDERKRIKIFAELTEGAPDGLAAELLEDLRTHGLFARVPEDSGP
ncbi:MAG: hypothetical protein ACIARR_01720 [Phycisphaerales bacterium JB059]